MTLYNEERANTRSHEAIRKAFKRNPKLLNQLLRERMRVLPAGYGSYVGNFVGGPVGGLAGLAAGKLYGLTSDVVRDGTYVKDKKPTEKKRKTKK